MRTNDQVQSPDAATTSRPTVLHVRARKPTIVERERGFTVVSAYVEQFWQSALGPTSTALVRHLARHRLPIGDRSSHYVPIDLALTRSILGVGRRGQEGKSGPLFKSIGRLARFGFLSIDKTVLDVPSHITVVTHVNPVPAGIRRQWPDELARRHDAFIQQILDERS